MGFLKDKIVTNAGHPKGFWGRWTMDKMNKGHNELTDWGLSFLPVGGEDKILDIGCGGGRTLQKLAHATANTVWGVDVADAAISRSYRLNRKDIQRDHVMICKAGVSELPFADEMFDVVTAVETVYFWPDPAEDFKEVFRVMKPGGKFMILTEDRADGPHPERWAVIVAKIDMNVPTADGLAIDLQGAGFKNVVAYIKDDALCVIAEKPKAE